MAQLQPEEEPQEVEMEETKMGKSSSSTSVGSSRVPFKFNVQAPEFVPRSHAQMPISGYFYPCFHYLGGLDWFLPGGDRDPAAYLLSNPNFSIPNCASKNVLTDDLRKKILKQVEYQFSDMSLLTNESLSKQINKDPDGYVPLSFIASTKKIKSLLTNNQLLSQALRSSSKLVVSDDGKKVRLKLPFTEKDKEELQSRIVVVENLPEDHSHQNLEKIFSVVGSVKTIRICHPQESNSSRPRGDFFMCNKIHALVEYESTEMAEKAVERLNDEKNWRKGLRVKLLLRCSPKSVLKNRKSEFDGILDDDDDLLYTVCSEDSPYSIHNDSAENNPEENSVGSKKGWAKSQGKGRGHIQNRSGHGLLAAAPQPSSGIQCDVLPKQGSKGPRMPDGTTGFTMGRDKPLSSPLV